jgi:hypothetical protein
MAPPRLSLGGAFNVSQSPRVRRRTHPERAWGTSGPISRQTSLTSIPTCGKIRRSGALMSF